MWITGMISDGGTHTPCMNIAKDKARMQTTSASRAYTPRRWLLTVTSSSWVAMREEPSRQSKAQRKLQRYRSASLRFNWRPATSLVCTLTPVGCLPPSQQELRMVLIATADESDESHVSRGENAGRTLKHIAVLRSLTRVGTVDQSREFSQNVRIHSNRGNAGNLRVVAILQEAPIGRVLGAGSARLSN